MAAPDGIVWGPISSTGGYQGRLGIYSNVTSTNTQGTAAVEVWFWTKDSCTDTGNTFYYDVKGVSTGVTEATTSEGSKSINHPSNTDWSTSNQTRIHAISHTYPRGTRDYVYNVCAKLTDVEYGGETTTIVTQFTIPKLQSYAVTYNANGGTGAPSGQLKYYNNNLTLSTVKPTRTGYSFLGWAASSSGSVSYQPGATYSTNAALTLYAIWKQIVFTIKFDANGGELEDVPEELIKEYGVDSTLPTDVPSKEYHNFLGWSKTSTATAPDYFAGGILTDNMNLTLYAVWELGYVAPTISNLKVARCTADGTLTDEGTYAKVTFDWACYTEGRESFELEGIAIGYRATDSTHMSEMMREVNGLEGSVEEIIGGGNLDSDKDYLIRIQLWESISTVTYTASIASQRFPIDVLNGGKGVSFGCPATDEGVAKFAYSLLLNRGDGVYKTLMDLIHPLGSVITLYPNPQDLIEVVSDGKTHYKLTEECAIHPNNTYPGTIWERIAETFLWACDEAGGIGVVGGSKTYTLTTNNIPEHHHGATYTGSGTATKTHAWIAKSTTNQAMAYEAISVGANTDKITPVKTMPPYVQVAMFRRVG